MTGAAVLVEDLHVRFGDVQALAGIDFDVAPGTTLGVLGHNGAGKTTLIRVLTTLLRPTGGRAVVDGFDVVAEADRVRSRIGVTGQYAGLDDFLTGRENLELIGSLTGLGAAARSSRRRVDHATRPRRDRQPPRRRPVGRVPATHRPGDEPGRQPVGAVPRRTHHRARSRRPVRAVGRSGRAHRARHHRRARHPVPRGGRPARRRHRRARPRSHRRTGHSRRAEAAGRRQGRRRHRPDRAPRPDLASSRRHRTCHRGDEPSRGIATSDADEAAAVVTQLLSDGVAMDDLDIASPTLDDVFAQLTMQGAHR